MRLTAAKDCTNGVQMGNLLMEKGFLNDVEEVIPKKNTFNSAFDQNNLVCRREKTASNVIKSQMSDKQAGIDVLN